MGGGCSVFTLTRRTCSRHDTPSKKRKYKHTNPVWILGLNNLRNVPTLMNPNWMTLSCNFFFETQDFGMQISVWCCTTEWCHLQSFPTTSWCRWLWEFFCSSPSWILSKQDTSSLARFLGRWPTAFWRFEFAGCQFTFPVRMRIRRPQNACWNECFAGRGNVMIQLVCFQGYDWVELFFLGFIPLIIIGFGVIAVLIRMFAFIFSKCCSTSESHHYDGRSR